MQRKFSKNIWLINYIPEPIRKSVGGFKDVIEYLFNTNKPKQTVYKKGKKLSKPKTKNIRKPFIPEENKKKNKDRIIRDILKRFQTEEEKQERKESEKKKTQNERLIKDKIMRGSGHILNKKKIIINLKE